MRDHARTPMDVSRRLRALDVEECLSLLGTEAVGRVAFMRDGFPVVLPMNYVVDQGAVVFRTGYGPILDLLAAHSPVAFEADRFDPDYHEGWSVLVQGIAEEVSDLDELQRLRVLPLRPWAPGDRDHYVRILSTTITGRRIA